jgi:hypothetical protein
MSISDYVEAAAGETTTVIITSAGLCACAVAERRPISWTWRSTRATGAASATALTVGAAGAVNGLAHRRRRRRGCARRSRSARCARRSTRRGCARRARRRWRSSGCSCRAFTRAHGVARVLLQVALGRTLPDGNCMSVSGVTWGHVADSDHP